MSTKSALKAAKTAIDNFEYAKAVEAAQTVLASDAKSYHANVFLGLALDKQDRNDESAKVYNVATKIKASEPLAWQGLISLYEKQAGNKLDDYRQAAVSLIETYIEADDKTRAQTVLDKFSGFAKQHGTRSQQKRALEVLLPTSSIYDFLEGRVPHPASTYIKIADIVEAEEKEKINKEIGERRTRLGAKIGQVTLDVKREVYQESTLEDLFRNVIEWTDDENIRRQYDEKLLQRAYDTLLLLPRPDKAAKRQEVAKLAEGLVILRHPCALAWKISLEWKEWEKFEEWDAGILQDYVGFFPDDGLSKVLKGYMGSELSPAIAATTDAGVDSDVWENGDGQLPVEDRLLMMAEGSQESSSALAHRLTGEYYLYLEEYESAADIARKAQRLTSVEIHNTDLSLELNFDAISTVLATALIQHQSPRNHPEAKALLVEVLRRRPAETSALVGIGLILEDEEAYAEAIDFLSRAMGSSPDPKLFVEAAWCKALSGDYQSGLKELQDCLSFLKASDFRTRGLRSKTQYRIGQCLWNLDTSKEARRDRNGAYKWYLLSLQSNMNLAPAYTSLGIYYFDYAKDKKRGRKCFQKAFELSPSEVEAAERLAKAFAEQAEWDLVEAVAQRVVNSGKVRPPPGSRKKGFSWPFAALGVVQINKQDYFRSIVSFQSALRISPDDYHSWVGLGESYHNSGRYISATKAFEHAQAVEKSQDRDSWFSTYMLANVKKELGDFDEATLRYNEVLKVRPTEFGVGVALLQTLVDQSWRNIELGFFGRAAEGATEALEMAGSIVAQRANAFNVWKAVGDACSIFSWTQAYSRDFAATHVQSLLDFDINPQVYDLFADIDEIGNEALQCLSTRNGNGPTAGVCLRAAILAQKRAIHVSANDIHAQAVAWYNLGWTEYRLYICEGFNSVSSPCKHSKYLKTSVQCFKRAIELEAGNAEFWNSLGVVTTPLNPKVAQHAFVRSLHLNNRSARAWTNLGTLYLIHDDKDLANDAFARAQSSDPDYAHGWVGQGLLADISGFEKEAPGLFTHAFEISDSTSLITKRRYALSTFDSMITSPASSISISSILQPSFALEQLRSEFAIQGSKLHLYSLFCERKGAYSTAAISLRSLCTALEAEYEVSESQSSLTRFAQAKGDLARAELGTQEYLLAATSAEMALDLSADTENDAFGSDVWRKCRLSAHLTAGLAYYYMNSMDQAIEMFRSALDESHDDPDVVCLLAQVLWAKNGTDERNVAREQLFDCVEKHPDYVSAISLLGVIAMLDEDAESLEAVAADLQSMRVRDDLDLLPKQKISQVLAAIATTALKEEDSRDLAELREATASVMLAPSRPHGWSQLAKLSDKTYPADMALLTATRAVPPAGLLEAEDLCEAYASTSRLKDAQRAIVVAPWSVSGWDALL